MFAFGRQHSFERGVRERCAVFGREEGSMQGRREGKGGECRGLFFGLLCAMHGPPAGLGVTARWTSLAPAVARPDFGRNGYIPLRSVQGPTDAMSDVL